MSIHINDSFDSFIHGTLHQKAMGDIEEIGNDGGEDFVLDLYTFPVGSRSSAFIASRF